MFISVPYEPIAAPHFPPVTFKVPLPSKVTEEPYSTSIPQEYEFRSPAISLYPLMSKITFELF